MDISDEFIVVILPALGSSTYTDLLLIKGPWQMWIIRLGLLRLYYRITINKTMDALGCGTISLLILVETDVDESCC